MRILIFGKNGQLGWETQRTLACLGDVTALDYPNVDFTRPNTIRNAIVETSPNVIVNAAAYTNVDQAELEADLCTQINSLAPGKIAETAAEVGAFFIHISTDYVFDGEKGSPYFETDLPNPLSVYAKSKLDGEQRVQAIDHAHIILRTSWMYSMRSPSFLTKVLEWAKTNSNLKIVSDQISNPTNARMLAEIIALMLAKGAKSPIDYFKDKSGIYHLGGSGYTSRYDWAKKILDLAGTENGVIAKEVIPALTKDFPTPATRPLFSALNCEKFENTFHLRLPPWQNSLQLEINCL
jgi:dTDP-4-dehydrorhamnose reductase